MTFNHFQMQKWTLQMIWAWKKNWENLEKRITSELKLLKDKEIIDKSTYKI